MSQKRRQQRRWQSVPVYAQQDVWARGRTDLDVFVRHNSSNGGEEHYCISHRIIVNFAFRQCAGPDS